MKPPMPFSERLELLMRARELTVGTLGASLGGRAELKRALSEDLPAKKRAELIDRLARLELFSADEMALLREAHTVSEVGAPAYLLRATLARLMYGRTIHPATDLSEIAEKLQPLWSADSVRIICVNSCYPSLFLALKPFFEDEARDIELTHIVRLDRKGCDPASAMYCATPLLLDPRYHPAYMAQDADLQCFSGDFTIIRLMRGARKSELFLVTQSDGKYIWLPISAQFGAYDIAREIIDGIRPAPVQLKEYFQPDRNYADMVMRYLGLELNRSTYSICTDLGMPQIPPEIAEASLCDERLAELGITDATAKRRLMSLIARRFANLFSKTKPNYHVTSYEGIRSFLETGHFMTHLCLFRDFTPEERVAIIRHTLRQARDNPSYHLHLLKETRLRSQYLIVGFDRLGVSVVPVDQSFRPGYGFRYLYVENTSFADTFVSYYLKGLIVEDCETERESLARLEALLDGYCQ